MLKEIFTQICQSQGEDVVTISLSKALTFWRQNYCFNFSTPCI